MALTFAVCAAAAAGCGDNLTLPDGGADALFQPDLTSNIDLSDGTVIDFAARDFTVPIDLTPVIDLADTTDLTTPPDFTNTLDLALRDLAVPQDQATMDFTVPPDLSHPDLLVPPDMAKPLLGPAASIPLGMGAGPYYVVARDISNDAKIDLVVSDLSTNQIAVLLGKGDGTFVAPVLYTLPMNSLSPKAIAIADFNKDGLVDLVVSNGGLNNAGAVTLLKGTGAGAFAFVSATPSGLRPRGIVAGDFNNDGNADVAVANNGANNVMILQGDGSGGFVAPLTFSVGALPVGLTLADFNDDGRLDLAVNCSNDNAGGTVGVVGVLINGGPNGGNSTFKSVFFTAIGSGPQFGIGSSDFNGDHEADVVASNSQDNSISFLGGNGKAAFPVVGVTTKIGFAPNSLAINDLNADGKQDVTTANGGGNDVSVLFGDGQGGFAAPLHFAVGTNPQAIASGDFNGDQKLDVAVVNFGSNDLSILLNNW